MAVLMTGVTAAAYNPGYSTGSGTWDLAQQLEILALVGNYHTISFVANSAELNKEPGAPDFPER